MVRRRRVATSCSAAAAPLRSAAMLGCVGMLLGCAEGYRREAPSLAPVRCSDEVPLAKPRGRSWPERRIEMLARGCFHRHGDSVAWRLGSDGVEIRGGAVAADRHVAYRLSRIAPVWERYGALIDASARKHAVPAELILTVII